MTNEAREARNAYQRAWRAANKDKVRGYQKKWRDKNKDKCKAAAERHWEKVAGESNAPASTVD